jgi:hypothetical protein
MASIFLGSSVDRAGSTSVVGTSPFPPLVSRILANTFPTAAARSASAPMPPMCMNITFGESKKKWL